MTKHRSDLTQEEALVLLRSDQMQVADYIALCDERGWDKTHGWVSDDPDGLAQARRNSDIC